MKKLLSILTAGIILGCACSCDAADNKGYIDAGVTDMGHFDFKQTVEDIELYGNKISLKGKFDDLGSGFNAVNGIECEGVEGSAFDLVHNGDTVGQVRLACNPDDSPRGKDLLFVEFLNNTDLKLNGISFKSTLDNVQERFGTPSSTDTNYIRYDGSGSEYIEFYRLSSNGQILQYIDICF